MGRLESVLVKTSRRNYDPSNPSNFTKIVKHDLHSFSDALEDAIGHVLYLREMDDQGNINVSFLCSNSKVAPQMATTIPRLELNAAVEAARVTTSMKIELNREIDQIVFHTDSVVVMGYINNRNKRFNRYVSNRIHQVLKHSEPKQWHHVPTTVNPADLASRPQSPTSLINSRWFVGPQFLWDGLDNAQSPEISNAVELPEQISDVRTMCTQTQEIEPKLLSRNILSS